MLRNSQFFHINHYLLRDLDKTNARIQNTDGSFQTDMFANCRDNNGNTIIQHIDLSRSFAVLFPFLEMGR